MKNLAKRYAIFFFFFNALNFFLLSVLKLTRILQLNHNKSIESYWGVPFTGLFTMNKKKKSTTNIRLFALD